MNVLLRPDSKFICSFVGGGSGTYGNHYPRVRSGVMHAGLRVLECQMRRKSSGFIVAVVVAAGGPNDGTEISHFLTRKHKTISKVHYFRPRLSCRAWSVRKLETQYSARMEVVASKYQMKILEGVFGSPCPCVKL